MNIQTQPINPRMQNTPAEQALIDAFGERLSALPGDGDVMLKRDAAIEAIKAGLPTRRVEAWHYTDLRRLLEHIVPDSVHVLYRGQVIRSGNKGLALELEENGYAGIVGEAA